MRDKLYRVNITVESQDLFGDEVGIWRHGGRYIGGDANGISCMLYFHYFEAFIGKRNEDEAKQFARKEVEKLKKRRYNVERTHFKIEEVRECLGRRISVEPLELRVTN